MCADNVRQSVIHSMLNSLKTLRSRDPEKRVSNNASRAGDAGRLVLQVVFAFRLLLRLRSCRACLDAIVGLHQTESVGGQMHTLTRGHDGQGERIALGCQTVQELTERERKRAWERKRLNEQKSIARSAPSFLLSIGALFCCCSDLLGWWLHKAFAESTLHSQLHIVRLQMRLPVAITVRAVILRILQHLARVTLGDLQ